ncbi:MAG: sugar phosphate isomerase/epimerase family protein [Pseudomonadota bacterium]
MPKLGLHGLAAAPMWDPGPWQAILERLVPMGLTSVEIPLVRPEEMQPDATRALAERFGLETVASLGLPGRLDPLARPEEAAAFLETALEAVARAGGRALTGVTYGVIGATTGAAPTTAELDAVARLVEAGAAAASARGLRLGIEPCNRYETHLLNTAAQARAVCERVGADNVFVHLDSYHMQIEEVSAVRAVADAGPFLEYIHLSEANRGVPGRGSLDWKALFAALADAGFDGTAALESFVFVDAELAAGLAIWRPVAADPDEVLSVGLPFLKTQGEAAGLIWR